MFNDACHSSPKAIAAAMLLVAGGGFVGFAAGYFFHRRYSRVNCSQRLDCDKVVDSVDIEDIGDKKAYCRCWKSEKFPLCDGSHNKHNKETGDNVGPILVSGKK